MKKVVFVDSGVLIAAARGSDEVSNSAMEVLDDPDAEFASSLFVKLEVLPKPLYFKKHNEVSFYEAFFNAVTGWANPNEQLVQDAFEEAVSVGLNGMDAIHVVAAEDTNATVLVTTEGPTKPIHRTNRVATYTIKP